jgi:hypothetical protein
MGANPSTAFFPLYPWQNKADKKFRKKYKQPLDNLLFLMYHLAEKRTGVEAILLFSGAG